MNLSHGSYADHEQVYRMVREASDASGHGVGIFADLQGPKIRLGKVADGPVQLETGATFTITTREVPGDATICSTTYKGLPGDVSVGDPILIDDGKVAPRGRRGRGDRRRHPRSRVGRAGQQPQGHQPARGRGVRAGDVREGHRGPALGAAPDRRLHRAVVRAQRGRRRGRAQDHARGGHLPARDRQDREAAGDRQHRGDRRRVRRLHGGPRRPRRGVPARGRAVPAEAGHRGGPPATRSR